MAAGYAYLWQPSKAGNLNAPPLIYTPSDSPRLHYILRWIFDEQLATGYLVTRDLAAWNNHTGPRINYSHVAAGEGSLRIIPHGLLGQTGIQEQQLSVNRWKHSTVLFYNQPGAPVPFDLFAAAFYLLSRYEEYLPHRTDRHGRYDASQSAAVQYAFLEQPVVDEWLLRFRQQLQKQYAEPLPRPRFRFLPTYDIDIAWKYLHKGPRRTWGGYLKDAIGFRYHDLAERLAVLAGRRKDPYDTFDWLNSLHQTHHLPALYFFLLGQWSAYDKNADPTLPAMQQLIRNIADTGETGIHPSYLSHTRPGRLQQEQRLLADITNRPVTSSRQHYLKFSLPQTYEALAATGISDDYSMGYASANGFRAGTSRSFPWYNLRRETAVSLRIHPFAFMEATARFYQAQSPADAWPAWERLWHAVKQVDGTFIQIWHNHLLGEDKANRDWRLLYEKILRYAAATEQR